MSQIISHDTDGNRVLFGLDHAIGWFITVIDQDGEAILEEDGFTGLSRGQLVEHLQSLLPDSEQERLRPLITAVAFDLDPGDPNSLDLMPHWRMTDKEIKDDMNAR